MFDTTTKAKKSSTWSKSLSSFTVFKYKVMCFFCCADGSMLEEIELECAVRDAIRNEMTVHVSGGGRDAIRQSMRELYDHTGYDMSRFKVEDALSSPPAEVAVVSAVEEIVSVRNYAATTHQILIGEVAIDATMQASDNASRVTVMVGDVPIDVTMDAPLVANVEAEAPAVENVVEQTPTPVESGVAMVVPRFVASVVVALRAKFGRLTTSEANRMLIEREYLRVCRDTSVRNIDVVMHQQFVVNAYFTEGIAEQVATVRVRLPKWLREAFGTVPSVEPTVC